MSFVDRIIAWWTTSQGPTQVQSQRAYVIDPAGMNRDKKSRERLAPGAQVKILQRLSRFVNKEGIELAAVFEGKELRAVEHEGSFQGVKVYFAPSGGTTLGEVVLSLVKRGTRSARVTVITDDGKLASSIEAAGAETMRLSTFRKALDAGGEKNGDEGGDGNEGRPRRTNRRGRGRNRPPDGTGEKKRQVPAPERDPVSELIDLID